jgi:hypothetical protein
MPLQCKHVANAIVRRSTNLWLDDAKYKRRLEVSQFAGNRFSGASKGESPGALDTGPFRVDRGFQGPSAAYLAPKDAAVNISSEIG